MLIEMGHNDAADPRKGGKYVERGTIPGIDQAISVKVQTSRGQEVVYSFGHYLRSMVADVKAKGAIPLISGMVPTNSWQGGKMRTAFPMTEYARDVAKELGVEFLDHTKYSVKEIGALGAVKAKALFPNDSTHTGPRGAIINAESLVEAVKCGKSSLLKYLNGKGTAVKVQC